MSQVWKAELRTDEGKGASRRLRRAGKIPAIIYGADKEPKSVSFADNFIARVLQDDTVYNTVLMIDVAGESESCIIKDMQRHPATGLVMHIDMQRANDDSIIIKRVPFAFEGSDAAPGVKSGGQMTFMQTDVEVKCLAKNLPPFISVDVSTMESGANLRLSDLSLPEELTIVALTHGNTDYDQAVVGISKIKAAS